LLANGRPARLDLVGAVDRTALLRRRRVAAWAIAVDKTVNDFFRRRIQPVNATDWLNISAGVW